MKKNVGFVAVVALIVSLYVSAAHRSSPVEAKAFFNTAIEHVAAVGKDSAIADFNNPDSKFVKGDLYVFAVSIEGEYLANGGFPHLAGTPIKGVVNAEGLPLFDVISTAASNPALADDIGVAEYQWLNPQTNQLEEKYAFVKQVEDVIVGVGYYE